MKELIKLWNATEKHPYFNAWEFKRDDFYGWITDDSVFLGTELPKDVYRVVANKQTDKGRMKCYFDMSNTIFNPIVLESLIRNMNRSFDELYRKGNPNN